MMNKRQALKAFRLGDGDSLLKECRLYGDIVADRQWEMDTPARYAGAWRKLHINWHGIGWNFEMHNGEVVGYGYAMSPYIIGILGHPVTQEENERHIRIRNG